MEECSACILEVWVQKRRILKTRTAFAAFLATTIQLSQRTTGRGPLAPTFYPIPLPPGTVFRMPAGCSAKKRRGIHLSKAVHTVCMALNFWFFGGCVTEPSLLQREPNLQHRCLFRRIGALIKSDGPMSTFQAPKMGRTFPELIAQLNRISQLFTNLGALLRPGEIFALTRKHLFLPADAIGFIDYALVSIEEPKSRFTNARRQTAKLDAPDLLDLVQFCFASLQPRQKLWPFSGQTFRTRFKSVLTSLRLPVETVQGLKALDPGSLRAGGATFLINSTENGELCRRRGGRWANSR